MEQGRWDDFGGAKGMWQILDRVRCDKWRTVEGERWERVRLSNKTNIPMNCKELQKHKITVL